MNDNREEQESTDTEGDMEEADDEISSVGELQQRRRVLFPSNSPVRTGEQGREEQPATAELRRECIVCMETILRHPRSIQPCPCGYWAHHNCLVTGVQDYEAKHPGCAPLGCKFCLTPYNIWPRKNPIVKWSEKVFFVYGPISEFGSCALTVVLIDVTFSVFGISALRMVYGSSEVDKILFSMDPIKAVAIFKCIPLVSIGINSIPWEDKLLQYLRRWSRLPVVGWFFPTWDPRIQEDTQSRTRLGVLVGGLLLPWFSNIFGVVLFGGVQSRLHRHLLGGGAFIILKGSLYMYYRQKLYSRQCLLSVEAYNGD